MTPLDPPRRPAPLPLVIGIGTEARRDDGCGLAVARRLRGPLEGRADVVELSGDPIGILDRWAGRPLAVAIDAVRGGGPAGTVVRQELGSEAALEGAPATSTHGLSLAEALALGRSLGRWPDRLVVYGIEVADLRTGIGLSPAVAAAVPDVATRVEGEVAAMGIGGRPGGARHA
jgi:hydrogenase maturation protease